MRTFTWVFLFAGILAWAFAHAGSASPPTIHTVVIENMKFTPANLHLRLGDRVIFKNADLVPHTATAKDAAGFDSGTLLMGQTWEYRPTTTGTIPYRCRFHPLMAGSLVVAPPTPETCP